MGDSAVEETLDRQLHEVDVAVHARTAMPELCQHEALFGKDWKRISAELSLVSPRRPDRSRDWPDLVSSA